VRRSRGREPPRASGGKGETGPERTKNPAGPERPAGMWKTVPLLGLSAFWKTGHPPSQHSTDSASARRPARRSRRRSRRLTRRVLTGGPKLRPGPAHMPPARWKRPLPLGAGSPQAWAEREVSPFGEAQIVGSGQVPAGPPKEKDPRSRSAIDPRAHPAERGRRVFGQVVLLRFCRCRSFARGSV
jgi:hypothetical protein